APILRDALEDQHRWFTNLPKEESIRLRLEEISRNQLDFFLSQVDRPEDWRAPFREEIADPVRKELAEALWITENYRDLIQTARDEYPPIGRDQLYAGPHADLLRMENLFSSIYSVKGWNDHIRHAIVDKGEILARKYAHLGISKTAEQITRRLRADFLTDHAHNWRNLLQTTRIRDFTSVQDGAEVLRVLSGPESPYSPFLEAIRQQQTLPLPGGEVANQPKGDLTWLPEALKVLAELQTAIDGFLQATRPGRRFIVFIRQGKLEEIVQAFRDARLNLAKVLLAVDPSERSRMESFLGQAIDNLRKAMAQEAQAEVEQLWTDTVVEAFQKDFEGRYPFDFTAKEEISPGTFSRLMNPKNGLLWETHRIIESLHNTVINSQPLVYYSGDFDRAIRNAQPIRDALFEPGTSAISVNFHIAFKQHEGVRNIRFRLGDKSFGLYDRPDRRGTFTWTQGDTGASIGISVGLDQWVETSFQGPWAILRLLHNGNPTEVGTTGMLLCRWKMEANILGRIEEFPVGLLLEPSRRTRLFDEDFFSKFKCPKKIGP
ncbi:MAG: ImcF-related family protein, partial [Planctomycetota bacterium]